MKNLVVALLVIIGATSCVKQSRRNGNACISLDKSLVNTLEVVTVSNCGDELPTNFIDLSIDWGDGNVTAGQVGTHSYSTSGTYTIKLMFNGEFSAEVSGNVDESKVQHTITVQ